MKLNYIMEATERRFKKDLIKIVEGVIDKGKYEYYIGSSFNSLKELASFYGLVDEKYLLECIRESTYLSGIRRVAEEYELKVVPEIISFHDGKERAYALQLLVS